MKVAIVGLPNCGKTTVFNALTRGNAETAVFSSGRLEPNIAVVKVPDQRLKVLEEIYRPKKLTHAEVQYVDIGGFAARADRNEALPAEVLGYIGTVDALLLVVRAFENDQVMHPLGSLDPKRDLDTLNLELIFSDLAIIERRLERLEKEISKLAASERTIRSRERDLLIRLVENLEKEIPIREVQLDEEEGKMLRGYQFLSAKPALVVLNVSEDKIGDPEAVPESGLSSEATVGFCARVEAELARMGDADAREFMEALGIHEPARDLVINRSYQLLGLISFLTVGEDEVRAWTIRSGTKAPAAGGVIHSDIERGFIRAEVVPYEDLVNAGSLSSAKKQGKVRSEGKTYTLRDGDISHFLFNV